MFHIKCVWCWMFILNFWPEILYLLSVPKPLINDIFYQVHVPSGTSGYVNCLPTYVPKEKERMDRNASFIPKGTGNCNSFALSCWAQTQPTIFTLEHGKTKKRERLHVRVFITATGWIYKNIQRESVKNEFKLVRDQKSERYCVLEWDSVSMVLFRRKRWRLNRPKL